MASVKVKRGTHGPRSDPYGYTQVTFTRTDGGVVLWLCSALGYAELQVGSESAQRAFGDDVDRLGDEFERLTGMATWEAEGWPEHLLNRQIARMSNAEANARLGCMEADAQILANAI